MYTKPYLDIPQQIDLLRSRGMAVRDEEAAARVLRRVGYYRLSAYWHPMRRVAPDGSVGDAFQEGTTFEEVWNLYVFDSRLRRITQDALERMEISLRTEIALTLGRHGGTAYRELATFGPAFRRSRKSGGPTRHAKWLEHFDNGVNRSKDKFVEHFRTRYPGDRMPIWIAVEAMDFGPLSQLVEGMTHADTRRVGEGYGKVAPKQMVTWARTLSVMRNVCAHHARLWNKPLVNQPSLAGSDVPIILHHVPQSPGGVHRYYAAAAILSYLMRYISPASGWRGRLTSHILTFPTSDRLSLRSAGFPPDWQDMEIWQ